MPYGTELMLRQQGKRPRWRKLRRVYARTVGAIEPHSHIRWAAARWALSRIPSQGGRVLDVATGSGEMAFELSSLLHPKLLATFDIVRPPRLLPDDCAAFQADATRLPIRDSSLEVVTAFDVIEHIVDDRAVLSEVYRVLEAGGHVVISVPTPAYPRFFGRRFHKSLGHVRDGYTKDSLDRVITQSGFETVLLRGHTGIGFLLLAFPYYRWLRYRVLFAAMAVALSKPLVFLDRRLPSPTWGGLIAVGRKPAA